MPLQRLYTFNCLLILLADVVFGNVTSSHVLPIRRETNKSLKSDRDSLLNFTELTGKYGYVSDEHRVITDDGYILTMFRIVTAKNCRGKKRSPPVLLMHGLLQSSDSFIDAGPNAGLAYLISDGCYDLWAGNCRGNYYSRNHVKLNPDTDAKFWEFDIEKIGKYDIPAMIDYVLNYTKAKKLNYIGFSQGCGTFFVMCSERPGYCDKAQILIALAPATRHLNTQSAIFRLLSETLADMEGGLKLLGVKEVFGASTTQFSEFFCQISELTLRACDKSIDLLDHVGDFHVGSRTNATIRTLFGHFPAGTSLHNMARYGQSMRSKRFEKFDYGYLKNLLVYGSMSPPEYRLGAVNVPVVCIQGRNDGIVDLSDVEWLAERLPFVLEFVLVRDPLWTHLDVTYSKYIGEAIMPKINEYLNKYSWV